jgi:signal transduction histidine kinase
MDALTVGAVAVAVAAVVGFFLGRKTGRASGGSTGGTPARAESSGQTTEADAAFRLALSRIGAYLRENVDAPLAAAFKDRSLSLRRAAEDAVAAIDDLHFFLEEPEGEIHEDDLTRIVKEAVQAYESEWDISVLFSSKGSVPVRVNADTLLDALYLVLHNAALFGKGEGVTSTVSSDDEWGRVLIRDGGPGFSAEALSRAYDPFYTTSEGGLGLGLSHARRAVELQGGRIHLRNHADGGAEVEISVPLT